MATDQILFEFEEENDTPDPDEVPIKDRHLYAQPYDLVVESLMEQISNKTMYLRPLSERPNFQRRYVWSDKMASLLIESILLNVPIPQCYLSQNEKFELDIIDGQQRIYSIYRFINNQYVLKGLEVLTELNSKRFYEIPKKIQRQLQTHTIRCILIRNESHPEIKFDVFQRLNTNTVPLNSQELRNCIFRGALNNLLQEVVEYPKWLEILGRKLPDKRMRDEEIALRFFGFWKHGIDFYRTPQKHWLNDVARLGQNYDKDNIEILRIAWNCSIDNSLMLFDPYECFRRPIKGKATAVNRALFDLVMITASKLNNNISKTFRASFRKLYFKILADAEFNDLISRAVDHTSRTKKRFEIWDSTFSKLIQ